MNEFQKFKPVESEVATVFLEFVVRPLNKKIHSKDSTAFE